MATATYDPPYQFHTEGGVHDLLASTLRPPIVTPPEASSPRFAVRVTPERAAVLAAILAATVLRFFDLTRVPPALNQDEAVNGYDAYSLLLTGRDHLGHSFPIAGLEGFGDWISPLLTFLSVPFVGVLGLDLSTIRVVTALMGVLAVPLMYRLGAEYFGSCAVGVTAAWLLAVSPWHVHLSRFAIPPSLVPTMVVLLLVCIAWLRHTSSRRGAVATSLVAALTVLSYPTMKLYVPLLLMAAIVIYWPHFRKIGWKALCYATIVFLVVAGPNLYLSVFDSGGRARFEQVSISRVHEDVTPSLLLWQYVSYLNPSFLFLTGEGNPVHSPPGYGLAPLVMLPLVVIGLAVVLIKLVRPQRNSGSQRSFRRPLFLLLVALVLSPVPGSLTDTAPHTLRAAHFLPVLALLGAVGAVMTIKGVRALLSRANFATRTVRMATLLCVGFLVAAYVPAFWNWCANYFGQYPKEVTKEWNYGLDEVIGYALEHEAEYDVIYIDAPYIYLLFYAHWPPSEVHEGLRLRRDPPEFNRVEEIGRYRFQMPPGLRPERLGLLHVTYDPERRPLYEVRRGRATNGERVLLVRKP